MSSISPTLSHVLESLDYLGSAELVTVETAGYATRGYLWRDLHEKVGLDAAFFRDGVPLVGFAATHGSGLDGLRRRLWNYGRVPLLVAVRDDRTVDVYNATSNPQDRSMSASRALVATSVDTRVGDILRTFSRSQMMAGDFAVQYAGSFRGARRVDRALLRNLRYLRRQVGEASPVRAAALDVVVGGSIIASYLADRGVLNEQHLVELAGVSTLRGALLGGRSRASRLFESLSDRFNGDLFGAMPAALRTLTNEDLRGVADLLSGDDLPTGQGALWPYDFSVIPPDLVSSVYEQLLEGRRQAESTYYTPRFLVDLVLDEVVPPEGEGTPRVVDLACGSGAFITEAFRRLAFRRAGGAGSLGFGALSQLLQDHIFGVDLNEAAARVTAFGLYLALLEHVDSPTIWESATLPRLMGNNVIVADAFADHPLRDRRFDVVVGNPPWKSQLSEPARAYLHERHSVVGDSQLAQAFLWLAVDALAPGGRLGVVMPAKAMLHNRSATNVTFRQAIFHELNVRSVVDLSAVRHSIFATAIGPAVMVADKPLAATGGGLSRPRDILHVAPHPRLLGTAIEALVVAPEEIRTVSYSQAVQQPGLWKALLWGSQRDVVFLSRLGANFPSLAEIIREKGWRKGQGYKDAPNLAQADASHLLGLPLVDATAVKPLRLDPLPTHIFNQPTLARPRRLERYQGPMILVARTLPGGRLAAALYEGDAVFSSNVTAIAGQPADLSLLAAVTATLVSSLGQYWQFMTSSSWGVERDTVETGELMTTPIAIPDARTGRRLLNLVRQRVVDDHLLDELDEVVFDLFGLDREDRLSVQAGIADGVQWFRAGARPMLAEERRLHDYGEVLAGRLTAAVPEVAVEVRHQRDGSYVVVCIRFTARGEPVRPYGSQPPMDTDGLLSRLAATAMTTAVIAQPAVFLVDDDTVYLLKTTDADRWSYNAALDDADRIFSALAFGE